MEKTEWTNEGEETVLSVTFNVQAKSATLPSQEQIKPETQASSRVSGHATVAFVQPCVSMDPC
ncbi:hypothetical protein GCM10022398_01050 [Acetobacter lovaniensis]